MLAPGETRGRLPPGFTRGYHCGAQRAQEADADPCLESGGWHNGSPGWSTALAYTSPTVACVTRGGGVAL